MSFKSFFTKDDKHSENFASLAKEAKAIDPGSVLPKGSSLVRFGCDGMYVTPFTIRNAKLVVLRESRNRKKSARFCQRKQRTLQSPSSQMTSPQRRQKVTSQASLFQTANRRTTLFQARSLRIRQINSRTLPLLQPAAMPSLRQRQRARRLLRASSPRNRSTRACRNSRNCTGRTRMKACERGWSTIRNLET